MKLNHECVRDMLLTIEEEATLVGVLHDDLLFSVPRLSKYEEDDLYYTFLKLKEAGFINGDIMILPDYRTALVKNLSYEGHAFLDNVRDDTIWNKAKERVGSSVTSVSISVIGQVAGSIIKGMLGLS